MTLNLLTRGIIGSTIADDFEGAAGTDLNGRVLPKGGQVWAQVRAGADTTRGVIAAGGVARAAVGGTGNCLIHFNAGKRNYALLVEIAALAANPVPSVVVFARNGLEHYQVALRTGGTGREYGIAKRLADGTGTIVAASGRAPAVGDKLAIHVREDGLIRCAVGGTDIMQAYANDYLDRGNCGMNFNGVDSTTAFASFDYYG